MHHNIINPIYELFRSNFTQAIQPTPWMNEYLTNSIITKQTHVNRASKTLRTGNDRSLVAFVDVTPYFLVEHLPKQLVTSVCVLRAVANGSDQFRLQARRDSAENPSRYAVSYESVRIHNSRRMFCDTAVPAEYQSGEYDARDQNKEFR